MVKKDKSEKLQKQRVREVSIKKLKNLYKDYPECRDCKFGCLGEHEGQECKNKEIEYTLNEIILMLRENQVDLAKMADKYNLKLEFLLEMLKGNITMKFSYYTAIMQRLHIPKYSELEREFLNSKLARTLNEGNSI